MYRRRLIHRVISAEFDIAYYRSNHSDVSALCEKAPDTDLVEHYIRHGVHLGYNPTGWFDGAQYLAANPDVASSKMNPFFHYLKYGRLEGRKVVAPIDQISLERFATIKPHFDSDFYARQYPDIVAAGLAPDEMILHYLRTGWLEYRDPSPRFSTRDYLSLNADVRQAGINPFWHYVAFGGAEQRVGRAQLEARRFNKSHSPRILFVGHSGNPAGAEIMLLDVIEWYAHNTSYEIDILILAPGPLVNRYQKYGRVFCLWEGESTANNALLEWLQPSYDYIYLNTVVSGSFADAYSRKYAHQRVPVALHIHEMAGVIRQFSPQLTAIMPYVTLYVAASDAVSVDLTEEFGVPSNKIEVHYSFVKVVATTWTDVIRCRDAARSALGIPMDDFLVMGAGTVYDRKGPDLFVQTLAAAVERGGPAVKGLWIGGGPDIEKIRDEIARLGLTEKIRFLGYLDNARELIAAADVFLLSSREDPFPLVCLEAASYGIPTVHFSGCSGISTLTSGGAGIEVEPFDTVKMAEVLLRLHDEPDMRESLGMASRRRVQNHYEASSSCLKLFVGLREKFGIAPSVSVIVPNYNHARFLRDRLSTIRNQTFKDTEVLVLDDASSDNSEEVIRTYLSDPRFSFSPNDKQSGSPFKQWEKGLRAAKGGTVWIAESDDFCSSNFLEAVLPSLTDEIAISFCRTEIVNGAGEIQTGALDPYLEGSSPGRYSSDFTATGHDEVNAAMGFRCTLVNASSALFHRVALSDAVASASNFRMCGDWRIYLELLSAGGVAYTTKATNFFRRHGSSTVHKLEGTDVYFEERAAIATYVSRQFSLSRRASNRVVTELEYEWDRFRHVEKSSASLSSYFDVNEFWRGVHANQKNVRNIAFYVHGMMFSKGGIEQQCALISRHLANAGYKVTVFCRQWGDVRPVFDVGQFVRIVPIFDENRQEDTVANLRQDLVNREIEVFIPMLSEWLFEPIVSAADRLDIKVIVSEHNDPEVIEKLWWSRDKRLMTFEKAARVHLLLDRFRSSLPAKLNARVTVIPNAVENFDFSTCSEVVTNRLIAVGRLVEQKGFDRLISALPEVVRRIPNVRLDIYGSGKDREELNSLIEKLNLKTNVFLKGQIERVPEELAKSSLLVVPSRFEGFGIVVVEAKVAGVPAIAYKNCNGPNELIEDGVDGLLVEPDETGNSLAAAILSLLLDDAKMRTMGSNARRSAAAFMPGPVVEQWVTMIEGAANQLESNKHQAQSDNRAA